MLHEQTSHSRSVLSQGLLEKFQGVFSSQSSCRATLDVFLLFSGGGGGVGDLEPALLCTVFLWIGLVAHLLPWKALISACNFDSLTGSVSDSTTAESAGSLWKQRDSFLLQNLRVWFTLMSWAWFCIKNTEKLKSFLSRTSREATPLLTERLSGITVLLYLSAKQIFL